eukprot:CCRYP_009574-RA/>CCRYP_009574-RA protein AED:0.06 eAED:-0.06 QI:0/0/0/0.5/1/1/2/0/572
MMTTVADQVDANAALIQGDEDSGNPRNLPASPGELSGVASLSNVASGGSGAGPQEKSCDATPDKYKEKADKYKAENKKLRRDLLSVRSKHEEMALLMQQSQMESEKEQESRRQLMAKLKEKSLEVEDLRGENHELCAKLEKLEERLKEMLQQSSSITASGSNIDSNHHQHLLHTRIQQLESELNEVANLKNAEIDVLRKQFSRVESKPAAPPEEPTALKLELENTRKQHRFDLERLHQEWNKERTSLREEVRRLNLEISRYRNGDIVVSSIDKSTEEDEEEDEWTKRYEGALSQSSDRLDLSGKEDIVDSNLHDASANSDKPQGDATTAAAAAALLYDASNSDFDSSDISCLQSIISTLRESIQQTTYEKEALERRLRDEQSRSQQELKAFARTLEGVDDLRKSAERMSREIRRIKIKGYRPTRSDLIGGSSLDSNGRPSSFYVGSSSFPPSISGELRAAEEASMEMEAAIRLIESQNDAMNDRWSNNIDVLRSDVDCFPKRASVSSKGSDSRASSLKMISEDDDNEDGFLSFWHNRAGVDEDDAEKKKEKKAKTKKKKKSSSNGSVFTSFF